ncbi:acyl-CoA dehydrogenase [Nocardia sp. NPDC004860]|uniref:acyl-CoA dehydrogenase n=1 Tax=Nocardia sp. NPDC004860 TaxID=3154557 RepID=UPI0033BD0A41
MSHYKSNVQDIGFNLFEVLRVGHLLEAGHYGDLDVTTARHILDEVARLAEGPLADSYAAADRDPVTFDPTTHEVNIPDPLRKSARALKESGWLRLGLPEALGGLPAPMSLVWAVREMVQAANPPTTFLNMGPMIGEALFAVGTSQQKHWAAQGLDLGWTGTMVLTEPDAGSDVGAGRTRAIEQPDGSWHIEGVKRFISGGDVGDLAENIFHLVLARPVGAGPGTKGLSLFYVPKYHFDPQTMEIGERNGVFVTGIEHKMGIRSSPTCEIAFGATDIPAVGWLVGDAHDGIAQMFKVIENARMMVGAKAAGILSTGYLNALAYARNRVQGVDMVRSGDRSAQGVTIIHHPEVRRSLLTQKAYAEGLRALYMFAAVHQDRVTELPLCVSGADPALSAALNDLLLPIVKGFGSERAYDTLKLSLQVLGGSGYLQDYPMEQYIRDTLIDTVYEGTTAIQANDFFFRKVLRDRGGALSYLLGLVTVSATADGPEGILADERSLLRGALEDVQAMVSSMTEFASASRQEPYEIYKVGFAAVRLLYAVGDLLIGWRLLEQARVASHALSDGAGMMDRSFYEGKIAVASFFARNVLPELSATRQVLAALDTQPMALAESAF